MKGHVLGLLFLLLPVIAIGAKPISQEQSKWSYSSVKDQMTDEPIYYAVLGSDNTEKVGSLLKSTQNMYISLKTIHGKGTSLGLSFSNDDGSDPVYYQCKFQLSSPCTILVRFDDQTAKSFIIVPPESGDDSVMFILDSKSFFSELIKSKKTLIRASIWNYGDATFSFSSQGLDWNH